MADHDAPDLEARVARLERMVERLLAEREPRRPPPRREAAPPPPPPGSDTPPRDAPPEPDVPPSPRPDPLAGIGERWLGWVGSAFVILAIGFLLKLSFDRGWITPLIRLVAGFSLGTGLLVAGLRLESTRRTLAQSLIGAAIALFYLVGFAGYQRYELLPFTVAMALMTTTTLLAFVLADRQRSPALAIIGVAGGLATPFLLNTGSGDTNGLSIYLALVLLAGGAIQLRRGWMSLLAVMVLGGMAALLPLGFESLSEGGVVLPCVAVAVYLAVAAASPIARPVFTPTDSDAGDPDQRLWGIRAAAIPAAFVGLALLVMILDLEQGEAGVLILFAGAVAAAASWVTRGVDLSTRPSAELAALTVALGLVLVSGDSLALLLVAAEVAVLLLIVRQGAPSSLAVVAHLLAVVVAVYFITFALDELPGAWGFREGAFLRLGVLAMFAVCATVVGERVARIYGILAYAGLLLWFGGELSLRENGAALVSIAWGLQGAVTLLVALGKRSSTMQVVGLLTLGLVAGKLLVVDLAQLDAVWRILLFLGFGGALLGLAYLVNRPRGDVEAGA